MRILLAVLLLAGCAAAPCHCPPSIERQLDFVLLGIEGKVTPDQARSLVYGVREIDSMMWRYGEHKKIKWSFPK